MSSNAIRPRLPSLLGRSRRVRSCPTPLPALGERPAAKARATIRGLQWLGWIALLAYGSHSLFHAGGRPLDSFFEDWLSNALFVLAAGLCLARAVLERRQRAAWLTLGVGLACWAIGQIASTIAPAGAAAPFPSLSDFFWLAFYPASYVTIVLLVRDRVHDFHASLWLDGLVGALTVSALAATFVLPPILAGTGGTLASVIADLSYPAGDLLLAVFVVGVLALTSWRPGRMLALLAAGLAVGAVADTLSLWWAATGHSSERTVFDALWPASALLLAHAAWQTPRQALAIRLGGWRLLALPVLFALSALGLLLFNEIHAIGPVAYILSILTLLVVLGRLALTFGENLRSAEHSRREAMTDSLTGLGNRRALQRDLEDAMAQATFVDPGVLVIVDLNGFKRYNDAFGHPAGDALLARLGTNLEQSVAGLGTAYRLGGDEFCALLPTTDPCAQSAVAEALTDRGRAFAVSAACGSVTFPQEAQDASIALEIADERLYAHKNGGRTRPDALQQTRDVLVQVLRERQPDLEHQLADVVELVRDVGRRLGLSGPELEEMARAAELHDIGKMAVPDAILHKVSGLDAVEIDQIREHTLVGERVLAAAPALAPVAKLVRYSHEHFDGTGYPDGLAGDAIPLGARIIAVCDAFHAMTTERPHKPAIDEQAARAELRRCSGGQFDPDVVEAVCQALDERPGAQTTLLALEEPVLVPEPSFAA